MKKVMAIASGGGHWVQLLRLRPAFAHHDVTYVSTNQDYAAEIDGKFIEVLDANMWDKIKLLRLFSQMFKVLWQVRPDVIITTGAAPGFAAIFIGKVFGAKTIWVDSIANSEELSKSGRYAGKFVDIWLTQWEHLAESNASGPCYWGSVL